MRDETRKQSDRLQRRGAVGWLWAFVLVALAGAGVVAYHMSAREVGHVAGTVQNAVWRLNDDTGQQYPFIEVKLDSGSQVRVGSIAPALPTVGDRITLRQRAMLFDYMTVYEWEGPEPATMTPAPTPVSHP